MTEAVEPDVDVVVIGSGFGGSVAALRAAEKGYRVLVLEAGRRFADTDFARTSWDLPRFLWAPRLGWYGVQRIHRLPHVVVLAGAGVGGGSLNYANTLYRPPAAFYRDPQWRDVADWERELAPHYDTASRMLGVVTNRCDGPVERAMAATADDLGVRESFRHTPVGVFFGPPGETVDDPYFGGAGPRRTGCTECGNCMVGCRVGAKNTLVKNYLALAEGLGVEIRPMRTVTRLGVLPGGRGPDGEPLYRVLHERTGPRAGRDREVVTARRVVVAAGTWGTQTLLHAMRADGELPRLSERLGHLTRTNSEALVGAMTEHAPRGVDLTRGVAITTSFHVDDETHVENCRYGKGSNAMGLLATLAVPGGTGRPRWREFLTMVARDPRPLLRMLPTTRRWSERIVVGLVMQSRDNSIRVSGRTAGRWWRVGRPGGSGRVGTAGGREVREVREVVRALPAHVVPRTRRAQPHVHPAGAGGDAGPRRTDRVGDGRVHGGRRVLAGGAGRPDDGALPRGRPDRVVPGAGRPRRLPAGVGPSGHLGARRVGGLGQPRGQPVADHHGPGRAGDGPLAAGGGAGRAAGAVGAAGRGRGGCARAGRPPVDGPAGRTGASGTERSVVR